MRDGVSFSTLRERFTGPTSTVYIYAYVFSYICVYVCVHMHVYVYIYIYISICDGACLGLTRVQLTRSLGLTLNWVTG